MELSCYHELSQLERWVLPILLGLGGFLFLFGVVLSFRSDVWRSGPVEGAADGRGSFKVPVPLALIAVGLIFVGSVPYWMHHSFPEDNLVFKDEGWTLGEVHARMMEHSSLDITIAPALKTLLIGEASGACWSKLLDSICRRNAASLSCPSEWHARPAHISAR